jgi:hypothetical protein
VARCDQNTLSGLNVIKGSTGYFVEMGGSLRLSELENLERLTVAA